MRRGLRRLLLGGWRAASSSLAPSGKRHALSEIPLKAADATPHSIKRTGRLKFEDRA